jgi:hypothetical protein
MKLRIEKSKLAESPALFLRQAGYSYIINRQNGQESFVRRLTRDFYPRFHLYVAGEDDAIIFNLHLDQKRPIYRGAPHAHNAEYEGEAVEREIDRLKELILKI